jgi:hypothetical protein
VVLASFFYFMNTGQIVKTRNVPFAMVPSEFLRDKSVSLKAKGLLSFLLSLPPDWVIYKSKLTDYFLDGKDSISSAWDELEILGYIHSVRIVGNDGLSRGFNYVVYYEPAEIGLTESGLTESGKPDIRKPATTYIDNTNREITHKYSFEDFWLVYDKKVDKKQTQAVWNKLSAEDRILAVEGVGNHKSGRERKYWKDPVRYLRDKRWEDETTNTNVKKTNYNYDENDPRNKW